MANFVLLFLLLVIATTSSSTNKTKEVNPVFTSIPQNVTTENNLQLQLFGATTSTSSNDTQTDKKADTRDACVNLHCPPVDKPVCARLVDRTGKSVYVVMVNKCEMRYIKCHKGLEGVMVSMKNCDHNLLKTKGHKRSKRYAKEDPPRYLKAGRIVKMIGAPLSDDDGANGVDDIDGYASQSKGQGDQGKDIDQNQNTEDQGQNTEDEGQYVDQGQNIEEHVHYVDQGQNTEEHVHYVDQGQNTENQGQYVDQGQSTEDQVVNGSGQGPNTDQENIDQGQNSGSQGDYDNGQDQYVDHGQNSEDYGQYVNQDQSTGEEGDEDQGQYVDQGQNVDQGQYDQGQAEFQEGFQADEDVAYQTDQDLNWTKNYDYKQVLEAHLPMDTFTDPIYDDDVDRQQYNDDCPDACPLRDVMVCARCQHGVYRTFLTVCHLRMFNCRHKEETLSLISREPCILSAPFLSDEASVPQGRIHEPQDDDRVLRYLRCSQLSQGSKEADPRCYWLIEQFKNSDDKHQLLNLEDFY